MTVSVIVEDDNWHKLSELEHLAESAVESVLHHEHRPPGQSSVTVLFTNNEEMASLNSTWRGKPKPTNVLSFPAPAGQPLLEGETKPLGDIVLASGVVSSEAASQGKSLEFHVTHLIVHGCLHLLGYDHESDAEAGEMEAIEVEILAELGYPNPYLAEGFAPDRAE
jgi:probable rRNA maturation factor